MKYVDYAEYVALADRLMDRRERLAAALLRMRQCQTLADKLRAKKIVDAIRAEDIT